MGSIWSALFSSCLCVTQISTWSTAKHLPCELSLLLMGSWWGKKAKRTCDTESSNTGNRVTASRKEGTCGCRKHLGAILAYLFSKQQRANLSLEAREPEEASRCQECFLTLREIHSFIHSSISRSYSSGVWSHCEPVTICSNDLKLA